MSFPLYFVLGVVAPLVMSFAIGALFYRSARTEKQVIPDPERREVARIRKARLVKITCRWRGPYGIFAAVSLGSLGLVAICVPSLSPLRPTECLIILSFVCVALDSLIVRRQFRALMARVEQQQGQVCFNCLYSLEGHGDSGRYPECGQEFTHDELVRVWSEIKVAQPHGLTPTSRKP